MFAGQVSFTDAASERWRCTEGWEQGGGLRVAERST